MSIKKMLGQGMVALQTLPLIDTYGVIKPEPEEVIARRMKKSKILPVMELLI